MLLQPLLSAEVGLRSGLGLFVLAPVGLGLPVVVVPGIGDTAGSAHPEDLGRLKEKYLLLGLEVLGGGKNVLRAEGGLMLY